MKEQNIWGARRGFRARRGDMSPIILQLLLDKPMHGYEVISKLEEKSEGAWRPSAGAIYPTLQMLEEQGLVVSKEESGKKVYSLTEDGIKQAKEVKDSFQAPWECNTETMAGIQKIRMTAFETMSVLKRVGMLQSEDKTAKALEIMKEAKDKLTGLLKEEK